MFFSQAVLQRYLMEAYAWVLWSYEQPKSLRNSMLEGQIPDRDKRAQVEYRRISSRMAFREPETTT
jgi:hypothetical protein